MQQHFIKYALAIPLGLLATSMNDNSAAEYASSPEVTVKLDSAYSYSDTLAKLEAALTSKGFTIFAKIDHSAAAQSVGLEMPRTLVLIYGNPLAGTPMMIAAPDFALELPLRLLVREDSHGKTHVTLNPSTTLEGKHGLPSGMAEKFAPAEKLIAATIAAT